MASSQVQIRPLFVQPLPLEELTDESHWDYLPPEIQQTILRKAYKMQKADVVNSIKQLETCQRCGAIAFWSDIIHYDTIQDSTFLLERFYQCPSCHFMHSKCRFLMNTTLEHALKRCEQWP